MGRMFGLIKRALSCVGNNITQSTHFFPKPNQTEQLLCCFDTIDVSFRDQDVLE